MEEYSNEIDGSQASAFKGFMKRDMDLIRAILLAIEGGTEKFVRGNSLKGSDASPQAVTYHLHLLEEAALIEVLSNNSSGLYVRGLTWAGHDFLDTVRDPEVWRRTRAGVGKVGGMGFGLLKDLATAYTKMKAKEILNLDL